MMQPTVVCGPCTPAGGPGCFNVAGDGDVAELSGLSLPIHDGVVRASPGNGRVHVTLVLEGAPPSTARQLALVGATAAENPWQFADSIPLRPHSTGAWAVDLELEPGHHAVLVRRASGCAACGVPIPNQGIRCLLALENQPFGSLRVSRAAI